MSETLRDEFPPVGESHILTRIWRKHFSEMSDVEREEYLARAMWCEACGSLTVDGDCDCTRMGVGTQRLVLYCEDS